MAGLINCTDGDFTQRPDCIRAKLELVIARLVAAIPRRAHHRLLIADARHDLLHDLIRLLDLSGHRLVKLQPMHNVSEQPEYVSAHKEISFFREECNRLQQRVIIEGKQNGSLLPKRLRDGMHKLSGSDEKIILLVPNVFHGLSVCIRYSHCD